MSVEYARLVYTTGDSIKLLVRSAGEKKTLLAKINELKARNMVKDFQWIGHSSGHSSNRSLTLTRGE